MARLWAPDGVVYPYLGHMVPSYAGGNVTVQAGGAWVDGHYCEQLSSSSVAVSTNGLVVVRFTPADNRFQIVWVNGAVSPTQTAGTWELPIARMTASAMTDVRAFVNYEYVTTTMIADEAVDHRQDRRRGCVTEGKLDPGDRRTLSIATGGGDVIDLRAQPLTSPSPGRTSRPSPVTFNKPAGWGNYEITVWGAAVVRSDALKATPTAVGVRASVGANNGTDRAALSRRRVRPRGVRPRQVPRVSPGAARPCSIDVQKTTPDSAVVQAATSS